MIHFSVTEPLLTPAEVATMFRVNPKAVTRWAKAGKLTSIRTLGGHRRFREKEVLDLLAGLPSCAQETADHSDGWSLSDLTTSVIALASRGLDRGPPVSRCQPALTAPAGRARSPPRRGLPCHPRGRGSLLGETTRPSAFLD
jgi:excisionase family DNA binding protein